MEIKAKELIPLAEELRTKRLMMGLRSVHIHKVAKINQGNYSKMENGFMNPLPALNYVRPLFEDWKKNQIDKLKDRIKYLTNLK